MRLDFDIIAHSRQRYETPGDWYKRANIWYFRISRLKDKRYIWLIFLHEVIEWAICQLQRVKTRDIDIFDRDYETFRERGADTAPCGCKFQDEPGDDLHAPYRDAHRTASQCEQLIAKALNVDWVAYCEAVSAL